MVESYLKRRRERIALALLVVDSRHTASPLDLTMRDWLETEQIDYLIVATNTGARLGMLISLFVAFVFTPWLFYRAFASQAQAGPSNALTRARPIQP